MLGGRAGACMNCGEEEGFFSRLVASSLRFEGPYDDRSDRGFATFDLDFLRIAWTL